MEKITSFTIDHIRLQPGIYVSRKDKVGLETVTTFDLRITSPNEEPVLNTAEIHTIEHLGATFLRNKEGWKDKILYFGPMGCRTGFYLLVRNADNTEVLTVVKATLEKIAFEATAMFGDSRIECGNYRELSLDAAKTEAKRYLDILNSREQTFIYKS